MKRDLCLLSSQALLWMFCLPQVVEVVKRYESEVEVVKRYLYRRLRL